MVQKDLPLVVVRAVCLGLFALAISRIAWLSDDSLITLRTVLNISHGWSFGFNALENVQGYTHPSWMTLWLILGNLTESWTTSILILSILLSTTAVFIVLRHATTIFQVLVLILFVLSSNAIVEYSTSGLENPLSFVLLIGLFSLLISDRRRALDFVVVGLVSALVLLTRLDFLILIAVPLAIWAFACFKDSIISIFYFMLGLLPLLLLWYLFSYVVYGSMLPNTFLAKRNLDIGIIPLIKQGIYYVLFSIRHDLFTGLSVAASIFLSAISRNKLLISWSLGIALYTLYVIQNGGDFMISRFLSVQAFIAIGILAVSLNSEPVILFFRRSKRPLALSTAVLAVGLLITDVPVSFRQDSTRERWAFSAADARGIADERPFYASQGLTMFGRLRPSENKPSRGTLSDVEKAADSWQGSEKDFTRPQSVEILCGSLGTSGIMSGPLHHLIDECALTDRYLANLKFDPKEGGWRIGHFVRTLPVGYEQAILNSDPSFLVDPQEENELRELWSVIRK